MFCHQCGKEVKEEAVFCQFCGTKLNPAKEEIIVQETNNPSSSTENVKNNPHNRDYAMSGLVLGILSFSLIPPISLILGVAGIVCSILSKRSDDSDAKASAGLVLSILGTLFPILIYMFLFNVL